MITFHFTQLHICFIHNALQTFTETKMCNGIKIKITVAKMNWWCKHGQQKATRSTR